MISRCLPCQFSRECAHLQARSDLSAAKKRVKESEERVDVKLPEYVKKKYW